MNSVAQICLAVCLAIVATFPVRSQPTAGQRQTVSPEVPAYELGAVLADRGSEPGLEIMAVTPGGAAQRMRLQAGDRLLSVNGVSLDAQAAAQVLARVAAAAGGQVRLEVARRELTILAEGRLDRHDRQAPGQQGCGYVSDRGATPRVSGKIFDASITRIDGASTPLHPVNRHPVGAGRHVLVVAEAIPAWRFSPSQMQQRQRMHRLLDARAYKALVVDVQPGTRYYVGARLLPERMKRADMHANAYWEPVVWKEVAEACR
jgi:membrane-associated protease RseP (regulator of RpoE activity)